jgi:mannitol-specific phosphotransferase system IIBC component
MTPRKVIGTVDTSEVLVAVAASAGFFVGIGTRDIPWSAVGALLLGGLIAAPIAAYLVRHVPTRLLGASVGGLIVVTNLRTLMVAFDVPNSNRPALYAVAFAVWGLALALAVNGMRRDRRDEQRAEREREQAADRDLVHA